jgi:hypothetical protein
MRRTIVLLAVLLVGLAPIDSQVVLTRYATALGNLVAPKAAIYSYDVSQAGPSDIEQRHRIYRSGSQIRDETLTVDGVSPKAAQIRVYRNADAYAIDQVAPRLALYRFLFLRAVKSGAHFDYLYQTTALVPGAYSVTRVLIDGTSWLPRTIWFRTASVNATGSGVLQYASVSGHWMPIVATVDALVDGKPARERITWDGYRFPPSLPVATFNAPPLPPPTS